MGFTGVFHGYLLSILLQRVDESLFFYTLLIKTGVFLEMLIKNQPLF